MPLKVAVGYSSLTGPRERNEDFCGVATPEGLELENKGIIAAVAVLDIHMERNAGTVVPDGSVHYS